MRLETVDLIIHLLKMFSGERKLHAIEYRLPIISYDQALVRSGCSIAFHESGSVLVVLIFSL